MKYNSLMKLLISILFVLLVKINIYGNLLRTENKTENAEKSYVFPEFDMEITPFGTAGAWLGIKLYNKAKSHRLMLKTLRSLAVSHKWDEFWASDYYEIALFKDGKEISYNAVALPWLLKLENEQGKAEITFADNKTVLFYAKDVEIRLLPIQKISWLQPISSSEIRLMPATACIQNHLRSTPDCKIAVGNAVFVEKKGESNVEVSYITCTSNNKETLFAFREEITDAFWTEDLPSFDQAIATQKLKYNTWMEKMPKVDTEYLNSAQLAWFILYNCQVEPAGNITRYALLSGKTSWLPKKWAWDDCFQSLPLAYSSMNLAVDQYSIFFDNQASNGMLPEVSDLMASFGYNKPPCQGWAIQWLIKKFGKDAVMPHLKPLYKPLGKLYSYWMDYCDLNQNFMSSYRHGNNSGWDNATVFDQTAPVEGVDLAAYLVLLSETLSDIAQYNGDKKEAEEWLNISKKHLEVLLKTSVVNNHFVSKSEITGTFKPSESLINYIPLILGNRLPKELRKAMVADLQLGKGYLTENGLASEKITSSKYEADGYWRGPIWSPPNLMLFNAMLDLGEMKLAKTIAKNYCQNMHNNPQFGENFDAISGKSLQVPGLTWTASAHILMANWLYENK